MCLVKLLSVNIARIYMLCLSCMNDTDTKYRKVISVNKCLNPGHCKIIHLTYFEVVSTKLITIVISSQHYYIVLG